MTKKIFIIIATLFLCIGGCYSQRHGGFRGGHAPRNAAHMYYQPRGVVGHHYIHGRRGFGRSVYMRTGSYGFPVCSPLFTVNRTVVVQAPMEEVEPETIYVKETNVIVKEETPTVTVTSIPTPQEEVSYEVIPHTDVNTIKVSEMWKISFWFFTNTSKLDQNKSLDWRLNLKNIVDFYNSHPTTTIVVAGYASKNCGTAERNRQLVEERGDYIRRWLVYYGIPDGNIEVQRHYVPDEYYTADPKYNQCVVVSAK